MKINSNKGMLLESIIETSINWVNNQNYGWFTKQDIPIKINKVTNNKIIGTLYKKSNVDYYGIFKGKFICFEAKQTSSDKFYLKNIKDNQFSFLETILHHDGVSFLILMFTKYDLIFLIDFIELKTCLLKSIDIHWCLCNGTKLELLIPGRIDLIPELDNKLKLVNKK